MSNLKILVVFEWCPLFSAQIWVASLKVDYLFLYYIVVVCFFLVHDSAQPCHADWGSGFEQSAYSRFVQQFPSAARLRKAQSARSSLKFPSFCAQRPINRRAQRSIAGKESARVILWGPGLLQFISAERPIENHRAQRSNTGAQSAARYRMVEKRPCHAVGPMYMPCYAGSAIFLGIVAKRSEASQGREAR